MSTIEDVPRGDLELDKSDPVSQISYRPRLSSVPQTTEGSLKRGPSQELLTAWVPDGSVDAMVSALSKVYRVTGDSLLVDAFLIGRTVEAMEGSTGWTMTILNPVAEEQTTHAVKAVEDAEQKDTENKSQMQANILVTEAVYDNEETDTTVLEFGAYNCSEPSLQNPRVTIGFACGTLPKDFAVQLVKHDLSRGFHIANRLQDEADVNTILALSDAITSRHDRNKYRRIALKRKGGGSRASKLYSSVVNMTRSIHQAAFWCTSSISSSNQAGEITDSPQSSGSAYGKRVLVEPASASMGGANISYEIQAALLERSIEARSAKDEVDTIGGDTLHDAEDFTCFGYNNTVREQGEEIVRRAKQLAFQSSSALSVDKSAQRSRASGWAPWSMAGALSSAVPTRSLDAGGNGNQTGTEGEKE